MASGTRWPTAVDYQTALQSPALCFDDPDLQQAEVHTNAIGLPTAATGNVAVVFRVTLNGQSYALRCFTRQGTVDGMEERYRVLNEYIRAKSLSGVVPTDFRNEAILVDGGRYPIALMPWVPGRQLHLVIEQHLGDAAYLNELAQNWRTLMGQLRSKRLAHGDLSDGNVLIDDEQTIRLIDYDAAFVPPLRDEPPSEIGKPNYQHPERLAPDSPRYGYYAENVDAFASLVIYLSLRAVAAAPSLWDIYHTGDNLIFVKEDYQRPGATPIWPNLRGCKDVEVRRLADTLEQYCQASIAELPSLEEALRGKVPRMRRPAAVQRTGASPTSFERAGGRGDGTSRDVPRGPRTSELPEAEEVVVTPAGGGGDLRESISPRQVEGDRSPEAPRRSGRRTLGAVLAATFIVLAIGAAVVWMPWEDVTSGVTEAAVESPVETSVESPAEPPAESPAEPPAEAAGAVTPVQLAGFYTGYNTLPDGSQGTIGLEINPPSQSGEQASFTFSLNSKQYQVEGTGTYDPDTGHLDLNEQYFLHAHRNKRGLVELTSLPPDDPNPTLKVTKIDDL